MNQDHTGLSSQTIRTNSADETFELAYGIGEELKCSTVILLEGDLGAGKTVFAKGIAAGLEIDPADVTSPTFTLVNEYQGRMKLYHLDLYRLEGVEGEADSIGLGEILSDRNGIVLIEWPERLVNYPIAGAARVEISETGEERRDISIAGLRFPDDVEGGKSNQSGHSKS